MVLLTHIHSRQCPWLGLLEKLYKKEQSNSKKEGSGKNKRIIEVSHLAHAAWCILVQLTLLGSPQPNLTSVQASPWNIYNFTAARGKKRPAKPESETIKINKNCSWRHMGLANHQLHLDVKVTGHFYFSQNNMIVSMCVRGRGHHARTRTCSP